MEQGIRIRTVILLWLLLSGVSGLYAQSCLPEGITFTFQSQVDSFPINYPNCTEIKGDVIIQGQDITNLSGLNVLTSFLGNLYIGKYVFGGNPSLISLIGLDNVTSIGGTLRIEGNEALTSLAGLDNVTSIGGEYLWIADNPSLTSLSGLKNLITISGKFNLLRNNALTSLTGLDKLTSIVDGLHIDGNDALINLTGLENMTTIYRLVLEHNNALTNLTGLENMTTIWGTLIISDNPSLTSITGLENLTFIGDGLTMHRNHALTSLSGLDSLTTLGMLLSICYNDALTSLSELDNIDETTIDNLYIHHNDSLSMCHVQIVCEYIVIHSSNIEIHHNASGCNSYEEVLDSCIANSVSVAEDYIFEDCSVYPNPFTTSTTIEYELYTRSNIQFTIYNSIGEVVFRDEDRIMPQGTHHFSWSPYHLPAGLYFAVLRTKHYFSLIKIVKK